MLSISIPKSQHLTLKKHTDIYQIYTQSFCGQLHHLFFSVQLESLEGGWEACRSYGPMLR